MIRRLSLIVLPICLALVWGVGAAAQGNGADSSIVPLDDPAYELMQELAQAGIFTGLPDGSFHGKRNLHRSEFTFALRTMFGDLSRMEEEGFRTWRPRDLHIRLMATTKEFTPELVKAGATSALIRETVDRFDRAFRDQHPHAITEPYRSDAWPPDPNARTRGAGAAIEEWGRGEVALYASPEQLRQRDAWRQPLPPLTVDAADALPIRVIGGLEPSADIKEYIAGHNAEMWRRLRRDRGLTGSRLSWLNDVFNLPGHWQRRWREVQDVDQAVSPDGGRVCGVYLSDSLRWSCFARWPTPGVFEINLPDRACCGSVLWGPPGSAVIFLRSRLRNKTNTETRYYAIDLRTGVILNAEWSRS